MTVSFKPLRSETGFSSPGFLVDANGNFTIANLNTASAYKINGVEVLSLTTLGDTVVNSHLTSVGTLTSLNVNSITDININTTTDTTITAADMVLSLASLTVTTSGSIVLSTTTLSNIDNFNIGLTTPAAGNFTTLTATDSLYVGGQNIKALSAALAVALS